MKIIILSITIMLMLVSLQTPLFAQVKTDTITVAGNCGQCKTRIEEAAYIKGVKQATWNKETKILTVVFNEKKTSLDKIVTAISKAGHDSKEHIANDTDYKKLPECCAYRTGKCHNHE